MNPLLLNAIGEANRFHIVEFLRDGPRSVGEIVGQLQMRQPQVSKHLKVLADVGVVEVHPHANQRIYKLSPQKFRDLDQWIEKYRMLWDRKFDRLDALLREEKRTMKKGGEK